eukprot:2912474-Amphidinium_carterae.1
MGIAHSELLEAVVQQPSVVRLLSLHFRLRTSTRMGFISAAVARSWDVDPRHPWPGFTTH